MQIRLIAAGTRLPEWIDEGVAEYGRRFGRGLKFKLIEIPLAREVERMRAAIGAGDYVVALEVGGRVDVHARARAMARIAHGRRP